MRVLLFGATGMVGQGVLRECLVDPRVEQITCVTRAATGQSHARLRETVCPDLFRLGDQAASLSGFDAAFFCAGVSSLGLSEAAYTRLTYDLTLHVATLLARLNPGLTLIYVSGAGTDSSERGRLMWARVKGRTENAIRALPLGAAYLFRPGIIQPLHGIRSKTAWLRALYRATATLYPLLQRAIPNGLTTTEQIGRAMIAVAADGYPTPVLETADINSFR